MRAPFSGINCLVNYGLPLLACLSLSLLVALPLRGDELADLQTKASAGDATAQLELSRAYYYGRGLDKDPGQALEWAKKSAESGHIEAMEGLAFLYAKGEGIEQNEETSVNWYRKAAEKGSSKAMFNLGVLLRQSEELQPSPDESLRWLDKAAEKGDLKARIFLGQLYLLGDQHVTPDPAKAKPYLLPVAEAGDPVAQNLLGTLYRDRPSDPADENEAEKWFRAAARQNHPKAQSNLGRLIGGTRAGEGINTEGLAWLLVAKENGEHTAEKVLSLMKDDILPGKMLEAKQIANKLREDLKTGGDSKE
jgi:TPR repeat protein